MDILLDNVSKRYVGDWIVRDFSYHFASGTTTGISGINGSGKSTMLKMISGYLSPSKGAISYEEDGKSISRDIVYQHLAFAAPYTSLIGDFNIREIFHFHTQFKSLHDDISYKQFRAILDLNVKEDTLLDEYSSGMRQKLQLALTLLTECRILLLDEPTSYLDKNNKSWFYDLLSQNLGQRTTIIASNEDDDFRQCASVIDVVSHDILY